MISASEYTYGGPIWFFPFATHQALGLAGLVLSTMAIHCGGSGGSSDSVQYPRPVIVTAVGEAIPPDQPVSSGAAVSPYAIAPTLPGGVTLDAVTGILAGTPTATAPQTVYTVTAGGNAGAPSTTFKLTVLDAGTPLYRVLDCKDVPQVNGYWCEGRRQPASILVGHQRNQLRSPDPGLVTFLGENLHLESLTQGLCNALPGSSQGYSRASRSAMTMRWLGTTKPTSSWKVGSSSR